MYFSEWMVSKEKIVGGVPRTHHLMACSGSRPYINQGDRSQYYILGVFIVNLFLEISAKVPQSRKQAKMNIAF